MTVGGCAATRSAGQASTGYGRIDELVVGVRLAAPAGDLDLRARPGERRRAGPAPLVVGSEGVARRDHAGRAARAPAPERERYEGWMFALLRRRAPRRCATLEQGGAAPDVARLSDEAETR